MEDNKLIAEFMGLWIVNPGERIISSEQKWADDLQYHTSWDWLMPVVEKIESLTTEDGRGIVHYVVSLDREYGNVSVGGEGVVAEYQGNTWFETVYNTMLEFIKWYNSQKQ